jgi:hypothetical protein
MACGCCTFLKWFALLQRPPSPQLKYEHCSRNIFFLPKCCPEKGKRNRKENALGRETNASQKRKKEMLREEEEKLLPNRKENTTPIVYLIGQVLGAQVWMQLKHYQVTNGLGYRS